MQYIVDYYSNFSFGEVYCAIYSRKRFKATHDCISDNIRPQMNILNMVNPIIPLTLSLPNASVVKFTVHC